MSISLVGMNLIVCLFVGIAPIENDSAFDAIREWHRHRKHQLALQPMSIVYAQHKNDEEKHAYKGDR